MRKNSKPTRSRRRQTPVALDESKRTDDVLQSTDAYIRALMENALDGIVVLNSDGTVRYESPFMKRVLGRESGERVGRNAFEFIHPDDLPRVSSLFAELLQSPGTAMREELRVLREDGSVCYLEIVGQNLLDSPAVRGIVANLRDVTERKQAEEVLRQQEEYFRALIENASDSIVVLNSDGTLRYKSPSSETVSGHKPEEGLGDSLFEHIHPDDVQKVSQDFAKMLQIPGDILHCEVRVQHQDGSWRVIEAIGHNLLDEPAIEGIVVNYRDITERKQMEQQLQLSGRLAAVGQLAAGVAHELNNPLTAVQAYAQFLTSRKDLDESIKSDVETIYKEAQRASRITANLLSFARKHEPEKSFIFINNLIEESLEFHAYRLNVNNIEVFMELAPDLPSTMADFYQLQQVFFNIITNAEQAMIEAHGKGKLSIKTQKVGEMIQITFADDGPGMPEDDLKRIFDPFFTTKGVGKGTGLGLSICYGIAQEHGGNLYARSNPGEGTTFIVEIPIISKEQAASQQTDTVQIEQV